MPAQRDAADGAAGTAAGHRDAVAGEHGCRQGRDAQILFATIGADAADRDDIATRPQRAAGIFEDGAQRSATARFIDAGARHGARHRDGVADDRDDDPVAVAQPHGGRAADAEEPVKIDADAAAAADDADVAQRTRAPHTAGLSQRRADIAERGQVVLAGAIDLATDKDRDRSHRTQRDIDFGAEHGAANRRFEIAGDRTDRAARSGNGRQLERNQATVTADADGVAVAGGALKLNNQVVADTDDIIVTDGTRQRAGGTGNIGEQVITELAQAGIDQAILEFALDRRRRVKARQAGTRFGAAQVLFLAAAAGKRCRRRVRRAGITRLAAAIDAGIAGVAQPARALDLRQDARVDGLRHRWRDDKSGEHADTGEQPHAAPRAQTHDSTF